MERDKPPRWGRGELTADGRRLTQILPEIPADPTGMPRCPLCGHGLADTQDTRIDSRIRVSTNPPDRQMPVSAASAITFFVCFFPGFLGVLAVQSYPCASGASVVPLVLNALSRFLNFKCRFSNFGVELEAYVC